MAGIVGYFDAHKADANPDLLDSMCQAITYVKNDVVEQWHDNHLGIGRVHHGIVNTEKQPIFNEDNSLLIFMDGEVYDYETDKRYLLNKGHRFKYDHNDAEFCLHLYEEFGEKSFIKLNGSFVIVIYKLRSNELIVVNDRFSSRPFFYYSLNGYLIFGSQLKAVLQSDKVPRNLYKQAILEFFTFQRILGTNTYYKEIKVLFLASILRYQRGSINLKQYWEMNYQEGKQKSKDYYADAMANALRKAVRRRTDDNHRYGMLLSGGLDARIVLAASDITMTAFTIGDFDNREVKIASETAATKGWKHVFIKREFDHYPEIVDKAVELGDGMYSFYHGHFINFLDRINKACDIVLHGFGMDAIYKGYRLPKKKLHIFGKTISLPVLDALNDNALADNFFLNTDDDLWSRQPSRLFNTNFYPHHKKELYQVIRLILNKSLEFAKDNYNRLDFCFLHNPFHKLPAYLNVLCLQHYTVERTAVFDNDLFDLYLEIPPSLRFNSRVFRRSLGKLDHKLAKIPNSNTGISPTIHESIEWGAVNLRKFLYKIRKPQVPHPSYSQRSWPNMSELIRYNEKMKQLIINVIHDEKYINPNIFNRKALIDMYQKHINRQEDNTAFLFLILTFGIWHNKYGPR